MPGVSSRSPSRGAGFAGPPGCAPMSAGTPCKQVSRVWACPARERAITSSTADSRSPRWMKLPNVLNGSHPGPWTRRAASWPREPAAPCRPPDRGRVPVVDANSGTRIRFDHPPGRRMVVTGRIRKAAARAQGSNAKASRSPRGAWERRAQSPGWRYVRTAGRRGGATSWPPPGIAVPSPPTCQPGQCRRGA